MLRVLRSTAVTSTFLGYRIYAGDLQKSYARVAAEPQTSREQTYFEANISHVKSVGDFVSNYRMFTYAMKAYGLSDLGNAKAFMTKVVESDLSDANSFARRLNDSRYTAFAKAFSFTTQGGVARTGSLQTASQRNDLFSRMNVADGETSSLDATIAGTGSVSAFESNTSLYTRVLSAFGLDPTKVTKGEVTVALESNPAEPFSAFNRPDAGTDTTNSNLRALAADFNFAADGSVGGQKFLQSSTSVAGTLAAYTSNVPASAASKAAAATESAYYAKVLPTLTSVDQIVSDPRLVAVIKTAFGLPPAISPAQLRSVLSSDLLDPNSVANTLDNSATDTSATNSAPTSTSTSTTSYQRLACAFNIATDGTAYDHGQVMSATSLKVVTAAYTSAAVPSSGDQDAPSIASKAQAETDYFVSRVAGVVSVDDLLSDSRMVSYLRTAFNLPAPIAATATAPAAAGITTAALRGILTSNVLDPSSAANTSGASARKLAIAFNFASSGLVYAQSPIQSDVDLSATTAAYAAKASASNVSKTSSQSETNYYTSTIPRLTSVDDLLADKRLVSYVSKAFGIPTTNPSTLRQVLTSTVTDPKSRAATLGGGYPALAAAFNIAADGSISHTPDQQVQTKSGIVATHSAYLEQVMESDAAAAYGDGVRLALYFRKVAPTITSAYGILADKALTKVVQTMLGLSSSASNADIDSQARNIAQKINLSDFQNPAKLDKMVARFSALYDLNNASVTGTSGSSDVASLFM